MSERLSAADRESLIAAARESQTGCLADEECCHDSLDAMLPAVERILAAHLADVEALVAAARAEGTLVERERIDDALGLAGFDTDAPGPIRAALHLDPSEGEA